MRAFWVSGKRVWKKAEKSW